MHNKILGIDISDDFISLAEVESVLKNIKINAFGKTQIPPESVKNGVITNPAAISDAILKLVSENNVDTKKCIFSISSPNTLLRLERLPFMNEEQVRMALQKKISAYTAFKDKEIVFDLYTVEEVSDEGVRKINVLWGAATKEVCDSCVNMAKMAGLDLLAIDIKELAVLRSLSRTSLKVSGLETTLVLEINSGTLEIFILKGNKIRFCQTVKVDIDMDKEKDRFVDKLSSAITFVLNFYQTKYAEGDRVSKMLLVCDKEMGTDFREKLKEKLKDISIEAANPAGEAATDKKIDQAKIGELIFFAAAIGSALHSLSFTSYPIRFNLIPRERLEKAALNKLIKYLNILLGAVLGIYIMISSVVFLNNRSLQRQVDALQEKLNKPEPIIAKANLLFDEKINMDKEIANRSKYLEDVFFSSIPWDRVISYAMAKVQADMYFMDISGDRSGLNIKGKAYSEKAIFRCIELLKNSFYFNKVRLASSGDVAAEDGRKMIEFMIVCTLRNQAGEK